MSAEASKYTARTQAAATQKPLPGISCTLLPQHILLPSPTDLVLWENLSEEEPHQPGREEDSTEQEGISWATSSSTSISQPPNGNQNNWVFPYTGWLRNKSSLREIAAKDWARHSSFLGQGNMPAELHSQDVSYYI